MAWQLLAAALPAAAKTVGTYLNKPDQDDYKPQTDYMKKYLSYLRGRQANRDVMHMAMQPQLRAVGQQGRQMQQQVGYDVAKTGLTGSGIEAQMRLSAGQKTQQALSTATEKAVAAQTAETARLGEKAADVEARIGAEEQRSEQAFKTAKSQWKKQLAGDIIGLGASVASAGIQQGVANKGAYQEAVATGQFEGSYDDFKTAAETGELPSLTGEGVDTVGRVSPSEYVQLRGARQQVVSQIAFSEETLGENVVKEYLEKGWSRQQIYEEASNQKTFERSVMNKIAINATLAELNTAVPQVIAAAGGGVPAGGVPAGGVPAGGVPAGEVIPEVKPGVVPGVNEDMKIEVDEGGKKVVPFDPESSKYNEHYGDLIGLPPATEADHRGSVAEDLSHLPENIQAQVKKELGDDVLLVLKGRKHETWDLAVEGEKKEGRKIVKGAGGYYYSVPDKKKVIESKPSSSLQKPDSLDIADKTRKDLYGGFYDPDVETVTADKSAKKTVPEFIDIQKAYPGEEYVNIAYGGEEVKLLPGSRKEVSKAAGYHYALESEDGTKNWVSETDPELQKYLSKYVKPKPVPGVKLVTSVPKGKKIKSVSELGLYSDSPGVLSGKISKKFLAKGDIQNLETSLKRYNVESKKTDPGSKIITKQLKSKIDKIIVDLKSKVGDYIDPSTGNLSDPKFTKGFYAALKRETGLSEQRLRELLKSISTVTEFDVSDQETLASAK